MQYLIESQLILEYTLHRTCVGGNKGIQKDLDDGIDTIGKKMTVCQLYAKQIRHRANVRHGTKQGRKQLMRILQEDKLGACRIENVKSVTDYISRVDEMIERKRHALER